jgi:ACS family pantothenate transporter-like MFS transporter
MYYWAGSVYACQATFFAWANDVLRYEEDSLRAVVIASMNMGSNAINAWWSIVFYGANFAPYFTRGMWAMIAVSIASKITSSVAIWTALLVWQQVRTEKRRERETISTTLATKEQDPDQADHLGSTVEKV